MRLSVIRLLLCSLALLSNQALGLAQSPESRELGDNQGSREMDQQMIVEHMEGLNPQLIRLVTESVNQKLRKEQGVAETVPKTLGIYFHSPHGEVTQLAPGIESRPLRVIYKPGDNPDAPELFEQARHEIEQGLRRIQRRFHEPRLQAYDGERRRAIEMRALLQQQLENCTAELAEKYSGDDDVEFLRAELRKLTSKVRQQTLEEVGARARREAIEKRIDELRERAAVEAGDDPLIDEMEAIVATRKQQLDRLRKLIETGQISTSEQQVAEAEYAAARAQLIRAQREVGQSDGAMIQELNNELSTLAINSAEQAELRRALEEQIEMLRKSTNPQLLAELDLLKTRVQMIQQQLIEAEGKIAQLERERPSELQQVTIRPLEEALLGEDAEAPPAEKP